MTIELRKRAEDRLEKGIVPFTQGWPTGAQALTMLHGLASAPETASDALKLLHELQVHQVELDLQHEQAEQNGRQLDEDLRNYTALFDLAPFAYVTLDRDGLLTAANRIAADWLAPETGEGKNWAGRHIEDLLAPECRAPVRDMLAALRKDEGRQTCAVQSRANGGSAHAVASVAPGGKVLMAFTPLRPERVN